MNNLRHLITVFLSIVVLSACGTTAPNRFYLLTPESNNSVPTEKVNLNIGVGPVKFPQYLNRSQMFVTTEQNQLLLNEADRWAEPVDDGFKRVLAANLGNTLNGANANLYPWKHHEKVDYQVMATIYRFETTTSKETILHVYWQLLHQDKKVSEATQKYTTTAVSLNYSDIAKAHSTLISQFATSISEAITSQQNK